VECLCSCALPRSPFLTSAGVREASGRQHRGSTPAPNSASTWAGAGASASALGVHHFALDFGAHSVGDDGSPGAPRAGPDGHLPLHSDEAAIVEAAEEGGGKGRGEGRGRRQEQGPRVEGGLREQGQGRQGRVQGGLRRRQLKGREGRGRRRRAGMKPAQEGQHAPQQ